MARILVIDDAALMRLYLRRCLENAGHEVEDWLPQSAMEVSERLVSSRPDLIITDYQMTGCNGVTVTRMAKNADPTIPVLVLTAFHGEEMETTLLRLGVRQILDKPITAESLIRSVQEALGEPP